MGICKPLKETEKCQEKKKKYLEAERVIINVGVSTTDLKEKSEESQ